MNRFLIVAATALTLNGVAPAYAEKSDRIIVENMRTRIFAARSELHANGAGTVELSEAEARLRELAKALDDNEAADARASVNGIEALIAAARVRANAAARAPETAPAHWSATPARAPVRKRIVYQRPVHAKPACRIASR
jgi:hypothetical protein